MNLSKPFALAALYFWPIASIVAQQPHQVALAWQWSQGTGGSATGFNIKRSNVAGGPYVTIGSTPVATMTYTDISGTGNILTEGSTYFYVVTAFNPGGESPNSMEVSGKIPFVLPVAPSSISATAK